MEDEQSRYHHDNGTQPNDAAFEPTHGRGVIRSKFAQNADELKRKVIFFACTLLGLRVHSVINVFNKRTLTAKFTPPNGLAIAYMSANVLINHSEDQQPNASSNLDMQRMVGLGLC